MKVAVSAGSDNLHYKGQFIWYRHGPDAPWRVMSRQREFMYGSPHQWYVTTGERLRQHESAMTGRHVNYLLAARFEDRARDMVWC